MSVLVKITKYLLRLKSLAMKVADTMSNCKVFILGGINGTNSIMGYGRTI